MTNESPTGQTIPKQEWLLVACFLVLGGVLRFLFVGSFHVEHFDEGVYASNRWFTPAEGTRYPDRHLYAPPLWPAVLEYSQLVFGPTSLGVMLPGILSGTLTIVLLWRLLRSWVGPEEALLAAGLLSVSGFHILFSRTALTDVPVTMLMLCAIGLGWSSLSGANWRAAVAAGVCTGLAWSVKYNGWFPLAVTGAGLAAATIVDWGFSIWDIKSSSKRKRRRTGEETEVSKHETPGDRRRSQNTKNKGRNTQPNPKSKIRNPKSAAWGCWLLMAAFAGAVWFPAWLDLQSPERGGYAAVAANHAGYLSGWNNWLEHFRLQFENLAWFDNVAVSTGFGVLIFAFMAMRFRTARNRAANSAPGLFGKTSPEPAIVLGLYVLPACVGFGFSLPRLLLSLALLGAGCRLIRLLRASWLGEPLTPRVLAGWMALAWLTSLLLMTPLYRPYPRLALPLYFALLIGTAYGLQELRRLFHSEEPEGGQDSTADAGEEENAPSVSRGTKTWLVTWAVLALVVSHVVVGSRIAPDRNASPWQSRLSMATASRQIVDVCNARSSDRLSNSVAYLVYVYGEPALYYHLCRLAPENVVIAPVSNLGFLDAPPGREPLPIYLVAGLHTFRNPDYEQQREAAGDRLIHVADVTVDVSDLLLLNAHTAREIATSGDVNPDVTIELLEMQPAAAGEFP